MEAVAPTIAYDGRIMGTTMSGVPLPCDRWAAVTRVEEGEDMGARLGRLARRAPLAARRATRRG